MMLRRRMPRARPGVRGSSKRNPSPSGPRCCRAAAMARTRDWACWSLAPKGATKATTQMPHTLLFNLRSGKKSGARAGDMVAQVETRDAQAMIGIPGKQQAKNKEEAKKERG